jgi:hypothetical protein
MTEQFDWLDTIAEQAAFEPNVGARRQNTPSAWRLSPGILRAKPAHPPAPAPAEPEARTTAEPPPCEPASQPMPVLPRVISTPEELVDLIRRRRDELGITHETIDHLTGWASGYASKLLSPEPLKGLGEKSLALVLDALALGIARLEFVEDPELAARMRPRWVKRRRRRMRPRRTRSELNGALLDRGTGKKLLSTNEEDKHGETTPEFPHEP